MVEECLRYVREADVLVGIIAWRYGWEPPGSEISITEMEYDAAEERLMFVIDSSIPVNPDEDFDPGSERWDKQKKLEAFKSKIPGDQLPAVFSETTLGSKVLDALNKWRDDKENGEPPEPPPQPQVDPPPTEIESLEEEIQRYSRKAESFHASLPVAGFAKPLRLPINIDDIYVPLHAMLDLRGECEAQFGDAEHAAKCIGRGGVEIALSEAFRQSEQRGMLGLALLGDPGSGKTTHLKRLLLACLRRGPQELGLPAETLQIFLPLRESADPQQGLAEYIQSQLASRHLKTRSDFGERLLKRGHLLFLLDGLDEVADVDRREQVARWISDALGAYRDSRFVVACRFAGYSSGVRLSEQFLEMHLRPMTTSQVQRIVHNWYKVVEKRLAKDPLQAESIAAERAEELLLRLAEPDFRSRRVYGLARNPLLLTNICLVHRDRGTLPKRRAQLYDECIDVLLEYWRRSKKLGVDVSAADGRRVMQPVALWMHGQKGRSRPVMLEFILEALKEIRAGKPVDLARIYLYAIHAKMERDIKSERTFTSMADKIYFMCELDWKMVTTDKMSLNYRLFPDCLQQLFGPEVAEAKDLDHWHYDMMGNNLLIRNDDGDYMPAHRSLLEFFLAYKLMAEVGLLPPDFIGPAARQSHIDTTLQPQGYTWRDYFRRTTDRAGQIQKIAPLKSFVPQNRDAALAVLGAMGDAVLRFVHEITNTEAVRLPFHEMLAAIWEEFKTEKRDPAKMQELAQFILKFRGLSQEWEAGAGSGNAVRQFWQQQWTGEINAVRELASSETVSLASAGECPIEFKMVRLAPGSFLMGDEVDGPIHRVKISRPFLIATETVTQALYKVVTGKNPSDFKGQTLPVETVSWDDAVRFCNRLSELLGLAPAYRITGDSVEWLKGSPGFRLPTARPNAPVTLVR